MKSKNANNEIIYLDLFSGVGGFSKGFEDAKLPIKHHYFSEIDKDAIAVYKYQFKNAKYVGSVTDVSGTELRNKHTRGRFIITFGFPCQDLSVAGEGKGFDGERSVLFFEAIRIVREVNPEVFIFENVKGLLSHNDQKTFEIVLRTIADIGLYVGEWQLVNTSWILPQNRERIYFIGHLTGQSKPRVFPFRKSDFRHTKEVQRKRLIRGRNKNTSGCLDTRGTNAYDRADLDNLIYPFHEKTSNVCIPVLTPDRKEKRQNGRRFKEDGEPAFTLNTQDRHGVQINSGIRRLTEIECERLQGFPDNWTKYGDYDGEIKEVSKTQRYKQMGNAVTTDWPRMICERLFNNENN